MSRFQRMISLDLSRTAPPLTCALEVDGLPLYMPPLSETLSLQSVSYYYDIYSADFSFENYSMYLHV